MRSLAVITACIAGSACGFQSNSDLDGAPAHDTSVDATPDTLVDGPGDGPLLDVAPDAPPDASHGRVADHIIGQWTFDETNGTVVHDSGPYGVDLTGTAGSFTWASSELTISGTPLVASAQTPPLGLDIRGTGAATLEAWVSPATTAQGTAHAAVVAGLDASINSRDVSLLQQGTKWIARFRNGADQNGQVLTSASDVTTAMTHLVITFDGGAPHFYVNGVDEADGTPGGPSAWEAYKFVIANEPQGNGPWTGTYALVVLYDRALTSAEVTDNFAAGPSAL